MKSATIDVKGMHCQSCARLITESLTDLDGVHGARVSIERGTAEIEYDPGKVDERALRMAIESGGYEAR